jgi:hypothetical protein
MINYLDLLQKPMLMSSNKLLKRKRKISLLSSTTDSIYLSSLVAVALEAGCIKCSWTTDLDNSVKERRSRTRHSTLQKLKLKLKYLD